MHVQRFVIAFCSVPVICGLVEIYSVVSVLVVFAKFRHPAC